MRAYEHVLTRRVLLTADDRRFRAMAATLLSQRGYAVSVCARGSDIAEIARRERADVVVIDASASLTAAARQAARISALRPLVGVVAVSTESPCGLAALPVVPKWGPFEALFAAIESAAGAPRPRSTPPRALEPEEVSGVPS